jgi:hypothetical protein
MNPQKTKSNQRYKIAVSLLSAALLIFISSASAQLTVTGNSQLGSSLPFTPTWTPVTGGLLDGLAPSSFVGDFGEYGTGGNVNNLTTVGESVQIRAYSGAGNLEMCGDDGNATTAAAGRNAVYTLPSSPHGYNITNITVYGGWQDGGRDAQEYTVLYSTVADPTRFFVLTTVVYNPVDTTASPSATQVIINDLSGAPIATNVAALKFDWASMGGENRSAGYTAITAFGTPASGPVTNPNLQVNGTSQTGTAPFAPSWTVETPDLIAGQAPNLESGDFTGGGGNGTDPSVSPSVLTDGSPGAYNTYSTISACGPSGGHSLIYALTNNTVNANGINVTNIVVYNGWADGGRDGQYYIVSYSTVSSPFAFVPLTTVFYSPDWNGNGIANRVAIQNADGSPLALNVASLKFDFNSPPNAGNFYHGFQGFGEIVVQGTNSLAAPLLPPSPLLAQDISPSYAETVVGDQVVFTAAYTNSIPANVQWQQLVSSPAATNNINAGVVTITNNGVITSTLTLNNVQPTNSGSYWLEAINATNSLGIAYSTPAPLVVSNLPPAVNNVILEIAGQCGPLSGSTNFSPGWTINTNNDLILGFPTDGSGSPGTATAGVGEFSTGGANPDPTILVDGSFGSELYDPNVSQTLVSCGIQGAGDTMTYTLNTAAAPNGFDLTNITVYGGWSDNTHNQQQYEVLYATVANPSSFVSLGTFTYNANDPSDTPSATRTTLVPVSGLLARGVAVVMFNWDLQNPAPLNDSGGYSELIVQGKASPPVPSLVANIDPAAAEDVVGSQLILTASFNGATSYQWLKNSTNLPGATATTLTFTNLKLSDAGTYSLVASNSSGASASGSCVVTVNPAPTAVGNLITSFAIQTFSAYVGPTWDTSGLVNSLIYQQDTPAGGYDTNNFMDPGAGVRDSDTAGGLPILTDGSYGTFDPEDDHAFASCGDPGSGAGEYVIYTLPATSTNGYNITNIIIAGGWNDIGREAQQYTIRYSTVAKPTNFIYLLSVDENPGINAKIQIRSTFTPVNGVLASNVAQVYVDFTQPGNVPNGWSGISEIAVFGSPSVPQVLPPPGTVLNPSFEDDVAGGVGIDVPTVPSYWTAFNEAGGADIGSQNASPGVFTVNNPLAAPAAGNQFGFVNIFTGNPTGGIYQDVGALQPNTVYTLTVAIGSREDRVNSPGIISLVNGTDNTGLVLATGGGLPANQNSWQDYSVTFTTGASVSGDLTIVLSVLPAGTIQADFDNVRLTVLPAPPVINPPKVSGGNLILTGTGVANSGYTLLTTTNLATPIIWTTNTTGTLSGTGYFSNSIPIGTTPVRFFQLRTP